MHPMPKGMLQEVQPIIAQFAEQVSMAMPQWTQARDPAAFIAVEQGAHALGRQLADDLVAMALRRILAAPFSAECVGKATGTGRFRANCSRKTRVTLLGGSTHEIETPYMIAAKRPRRKKRSSGLYPSLAGLGF